MGKENLQIRITRTVENMNPMILTVLGCCEELPNEHFSDNP